MINDGAIDTWRERQGYYIWIVYLAYISRREPHFRPLGIIMSRYIIRGGVMYGRRVFFISFGESILFVIEIGFFVVVPSCRLATASIDIEDHLSPRYATRCFSSGRFRRDNRLLQQQRLS